MHVIISTRGSRRWISGVFVDAQEAHRCLASIPIAAAVNHAIERVLPSRFPFFVLEDGMAFKFLSAAEATHAIESMATAVPNDPPVLFAFLSEYHPDIPGRDEMGRIRHVHLDQERVAELRRHGLHSLTT